MFSDNSEDLQNLIDRFSQSPESRLFAPLADVYRKQGDVDRAIQLCEEGLERFPDYASAHVILGKCFYDKGATERARGEFQRVLELDQENMVALKFMGDILLAEDKRDNAAEYYRKLLSIDPMNEEVARALKEMEEQFQVKEIDLGDSKSVKRIDHPRELATMTLAGIYAAQGYYNKSLGIYQEILQKEPANKEARDMIGKLQTILDSSERERGMTFDDEVLTISLDDVSEEIAESTVGKGGLGDEGSGEGEDETAPSAPEGEYPGDEAETSERELAEELESREDKAQRGDGEAEPASGEQGAEAAGEEAAPDKSGTVGREVPREMENFQTWVDGMKENTENND